MRQARWRHTGSVRLSAGVLICAALIASLFGGATAEAQEQAPVVHVSEVKLRRIAPVTEVPATIIARADAAVTSNVAGRLEWIADEGAAVEAGEPVARIEMRPFELALAAEEARVRQLEAELEYLERQADRRQELADRGVSAEAALDEARSMSEQMRYELAAARAARDQAAYALEQTEVVAPFPGRVAARFVQRGEFASPSDPVVRVVDVEALEGRALPPIALSGHVREGEPVGYALGGEIREGAVRAVLPGAVDGSRTFELRFALDLEADADARPMVGAAAELRLPNSAPRDVLAAPRDAIILRDTGAYVMRVTEANTVERLPVEIGGSQGDYVELLGRFSAGDRVVVRGAERLSPGQAVTVQNVLG